MHSAGGHPKAEALQGEEQQLGGDEDTPQEQNRGFSAIEPKAALQKMPLEGTERGLPSAGWNRAFREKHNGSLALV